MLIGILETGKVNPALVDKHGLYAPMFVKLLRAVDATLRFKTFSVVEGELPEAVDACDAWLVTGSKSGVYDPEPWIEPLKAFLRNAFAAAIPMIGVCFGHQIMAEAFGGKAEKSSKGWGIGRAQYVAEGADIFPKGVMTLYAIHQDQVSQIPPGATVLLSSDFCTIAALAYGDINAPKAISIQPHPEFSTAFIRDLITLRAENGLPPKIAQSALAGLGGDVDNHAVAKWFVSFMQDRFREKQNLAAQLA